MIECTVLVDDRRHEVTLIALPSIGSEIHIWMHDERAIEVKVVRVVFTAYVNVVEQTCGLIVYAVRK